MKVSPLIITQRKQLYDIFTRENQIESVSDLRDQVRSLRSTNQTRETVHGFLELTKDERSIIIQLIDPSAKEVDYGLESKCLSTSYRYTFAKKKKRQSLLVIIAYICFLFEILVKYVMLYQVRLIFFCRFFISLQWRYFFLPPKVFHKFPKENIKAF